MTKCNCQSFDDDGHPLHCRYTDKDALDEIKAFPNPYIRFYVDFKSNQTNEYAFALEMYINSNIICHIVDKQKRKKAECPAEVPADRDNSTNGEVPMGKLIFERNTRRVDEKHFLHCVRDTYFLTARERIIKKTSATIADTHNLARTTRNETSFVISAEELTADMHAFDSQLGIQTCSKFGGSLDQVLAVKHEESFGFEKSVERKAILFSGGSYYLQHITRRVVAEGNGRPVTRYSESVYPISTTDINRITPENAEKYTVSEPVFEDSRSREGVDF